MLVVMQAHRSSTNCSRLYAPNFVLNSVALRKNLSTHFESSPFAVQPPLVTCPSINCNDVTGLFETVEELHCRKIVRVHLGADSGQGFMKIDCTVEFADIDDSNSNATATNTDSRLSDQGRRRVILLSCTPSVGEKYDNLTILFNRLQYPVDRYPFCLCADLKLISLILGVSTGAARHPCPFCEQRLQAGEDREAQLSCGNLRTIANIRSNYEELVAAGNVSNHKNFKSCQRLPLDIFYVH